MYFFFHRRMKNKPDLPKKDRHSIIVQWCSHSIRIQRSNVKSHVNTWWNEIRVKGGWQITRRMGSRLFSKWCANELMLPDDWTSFLKGFGHRSVSVRYVILLYDVCRWQIEIFPKCREVELWIKQKWMNQLYWLLEMAIFFVNYHSNNHE